MNTLLHDFRYALRMMLKSPGFTAVAVMALALGIGANSAIFSVVNVTLLRPLPYEDPDRLVIMWEKAKMMDTSVAYLNFVDWRDQNQVFEKIAASRRDSFNLTGRDQPERLQGRMVSADFFSTFGIKPALGRDFLADEDRVGATPVVILDYGFWQRRFGGDPSILGNQLTLNNKNFTVIGITSQTFQYGSGADLFVPLGQWADQYQERGNHPGIYVVARLRPGVTEDEARAGMNAIQERLGQQYPQSNAERQIHLTSLYKDTVGDIQPMLLVLLGAVAFVLLIACANVANLLLARSAVRQKEIAIRTALGASRWRIIRQLLTESVLLGLIGGAFGLLIAMWGTDFLASSIPDDIPRLRQASIDYSVLGFTLLVSVVTGIVFGLVPALQASSLTLSESLKEGDRGSTGSRHRVRGALVIAEVALALVLLIGAGLMIESLLKLGDIRPGFDQKNLLTMQLSLSVGKDDGKKVADFFDRLERNVQSLPGVESVSFSNGLPFAGASETSFLIEGRPAPEAGQANMAVFYLVSSDYFKTMDIPLLKGRYFSRQDNKDSPFVAIIDEDLAATYFPGEDPIGKQFVSKAPGIPNFEIVGVVKHVKHYGLDGEVPVQAQLYYAFEQIPDQFLAMVASNMNLTVRSSGDLMSLAGAVREQVIATDSNQPVYDVKTMEQRLDESIATQRFSMFLMSIFAALALVLASVGIYGVMSYSVTQRTHEIGIRMALGAETRDIVKMVVGQGMTLAGTGVIVGLGAAFGLTRLMTTLLYGVSATDPLTFGSISLLLAIVALAACYIPARRATRVDPMIALRYE